MKLQTTTNQKKKQSSCWEQRNRSAVFHMDEETIIRNMPLDNLYFTLLNLYFSGSPVEPLYS